MKNTVVFVGFLLAIWIIGSAYVYVCRVRSDCRMQNKENPAAGTSAGVMGTPDSQTEAPPPPPAMPGKWTVYFDPGKTECQLNENDLKQLGLFKDYMASVSGHTIQVTGYADNTGPAELNDRLSRQRSEFMKIRLLELGIPDTQIRVSSKGELEPVSDNATDQGRALNRRTELLIQ